MGEVVRPAGRAVHAAIAAVAVCIAASLASGFVLERRLDDAGRGDLSILRPTDMAFLFVVAATGVVGTALLLRRRHPVGWLFLGLSAAVMITLPVSGYARYGALADPGSLPAAEFVAVIEDAAFVVWFVLVGLILHLTPNGRPLTPRWGRVATLTSSAGIAGFLLALVADRSMDPPYDELENPAALPGVGGVLASVSLVLILAGMVGFVISVLSLAVRFRRSQGVERQQLLWLAVVAIPGGVLIGATLVVAWTSNDQTVLALLAGLTLSLLPIGTGLAITRYHLYDVDRILSRGLTWLLVSSVLAGTYATTVVVTSQLLRRGGGDGAGRSQTAAVIATLAAVSVAAPSRQRIQDAIDRRFNRRRYDAVRRVRDFVRSPESGIEIDVVLRDAVGDPGLRVAYWIDERDRWVSADGRDADPGEDAILIRRHDRTIARIDVDRSRTEAGVAESAIAEATPELESAGLRAAIALQLVEVRESRARIAAAQLTERRRIERNLHDGAQQRLLALALQLKAAQVNGEPERLQATVTTSIDELQAAVLELRELANGLHPAVLNDGGLAAALEDLADRIPTPMRLQVSEERFDADVEATAWFVACEAVSNAVKHAHASVIEVTVGVDADTAGARRLVVAVSDDGAGGADPRGSGLRGIADRTEAAGGSLVVLSAPSGGTIVRAELTCGS